MSKKKENFNQAMYEMFGIGKDNAAETNETAAQKESAPVEPVEPVDVAPVVVEEVKPTPEPTPAVVKTPERPYEAPRNNRTTFIAEGTSIEGTLRCDSDVEICGDFTGELIASGKVILHSSTNSNVQALDLSLISCNMTGDANVTRCIVIDENSTISGSISAEDVVCSGIVRGNISVSGNLMLNAKATIFGDIQTGTLEIARGGKVTGKIEMAEQ